jgi:hypothetical protein
VGCDCAHGGNVRVGHGTGHQTSEQNGKTHSAYFYHTRLLPGLSKWSYQRDPISFYDYGVNISHLVLRVKKSSQQTNLTVLILDAAALDAHVGRAAWRTYTAADLTAAALGDIDFAT